MLVEVGRYCPSTMVKVQEEYHALAYVDIETDIAPAPIPS